ncbi:hypothetical protein QYF36_015929 [Acer negundo]|nr:hypothetical protein QYF36_015929 [Acer negundo]
MQLEELPNEQEWKEDVEKSLEYVPYLAKLRGLKKLDLGGTDIKVFPHGMEMLVHLRYLDLNSRLNLREVPTRILPKLSFLRHLRSMDMDLVVVKIQSPSWISIVHKS